jgi:CubicO group peptidase (beta-lactamase class C family)
VTRTGERGIALSGAVVVAHRGRPMTTVTGGGCTATSRFQIASVSKVFAAALAMRLAERGALDPDEPITRWLPEAPAAWRDLTPHHFLTHTSGIGHWKDVPGLHPARLGPPGAALAAVLQAPFAYEPGAAWRYSSPGYLVVGTVVERAAGIPYGDLLAAEILRPLGLADTAAGRQPDGAVPGHRDGAPVEPWDLSGMTGAGDMWSTVDDLTAFARAFDAGEVVGAESLARMRRPHAAFPEPDRSPDGRLVLTGYGYGLYVGEFDGRPASQHTGDNPGYCSLLAWLPDGVTLAGLSNDEATDWDEVLASLT